MKHSQWIYWNTSSFKFRSLFNNFLIKSTHDFNTPVNIQWTRIDKRISPLWHFINSKQNYTWSEKKFNSDHNKGRLSLQVMLFYYLHSHLQTHSQSYSHSQSHSHSYSNSRYQSYILTLKFTDINSKVFIAEIEPRTNDNKTVVKGRSNSVIKYM